MSTYLLLITASLLGTLAFFEPCTIATHTLFAVRTHAQSRLARVRALAALWLSRSFLMVGLLSLSVAVAEPPRWGEVLPGVILVVIASLYFASRFVYLPVPHLVFHRLLPGADRWPQAVQLGLTLPACALPLFLIVLGLVVTLDSFALAVLAGLLFAGLFTLPTVVTTFSGLPDSGRRLLKAAAQATPFFTAVVLYGAAGYLLLMRSQHGY
jgi:cytochrome c-type biogenesis protein